MGFQYFTPTPSISPSMKTQKLKAVYFGRWGEGLACLYLRLKGYRILERNLRTPVGEIDIVARHKKTLCFIEVKSRRTRAEALEALSVFQQKRIVRAAGAFLSYNPRYCDHDIRFDFIGITSLGRPLHLKNAWFDET